MKYLYPLIVLIVKFIGHVFNYIFVTISFLITNFLLLLYHFSFNRCYSWSDFRIALKKLLKEIKLALEA